MFRFSSIENDFVTWKEDMWPAVLEHYGIDLESLTFSQGLIRQYDLAIHTDLPDETVFSGEMAKLKSLIHQKP